MGLWGRLAVVFGVLAIACFVVMAVSYDSGPAVEATYFDEAVGTRAVGKVFFLDEGVNHRPWMGAGIAFLVSAAAVAATGLRLRSRREGNGSRLREGAGELGEDR
jgi:hypothetical protein